MITEDFTIIKEIFSIIDAGIIDDYDSLRFEAEAGNGYIDIELTIKNGTDITNTKIEINNSILYRLVKRLKTNAEQRGECWTSFIMSYNQGGQVKTKFNYDGN